MPIAHFTFGMLDRVLTLGFDTRFSCSLPYLVRNPFFVIVLVDQRSPLLMIVLLVQFELYR